MSIQHKAITMCIDEEKRDNLSTDITTPITLLCVLGVFVLVALVVIVDSFNYKPFGRDPFGPGGLPRAVAIGIVAFSLVGFGPPLKALRSSRATCKDSQPSKRASQANARSNIVPLLSFIAIVAYIFLLVTRFPGFIPSTALMLATEAWLMKHNGVSRKDKVVIAAYSIITALIAYIVFVRMLYLLL